MNPNRQNNRCGTPGGPGFGGRPIGRPNGPGCNQQNQVLAGIIGAENNCGTDNGNGAVVANNCNSCNNVVVTNNSSCANAVAVNDSCGCNSGSSGVISTANEGTTSDTIFTQNNTCRPETVLRGLPIAMAYVPIQSYSNLYSPQQALKNGTLFRELDLEFAGRRCN